MRSVHDPAARESLSSRLRALTPDASPRWGRMNAAQMVCHVGDQVRCALGDIPTRKRKTPLHNPVLRMLFVHLLPWPKGRVQTVPEMQSTPPGEWEADLRSVEALLARAAERGTEGEWAEHPAFGPLSGKEWGWLIYKHTDYHLRQFGV